MALFWLCRGHVGVLARMWVCLRACGCACTHVGMWACLRAWRGVVAWVCTGAHDMCALPSVCTDLAATGRVTNKGTVTYLPAAVWVLLWKGKGGTLGPWKEAGRAVFTRVCPGRAMLVCREKNKTGRRQVFVRMRLCGHARHVGLAGWRISAES